MEYKFFEEALQQEFVDAPQGSSTPQGNTTGLHVSMDLGKAPLSPSTPRTPCFPWIRTTLCTCRMAKAGHRPRPKGPRVVGLVRGLSRRVEDWFLGLAYSRNPSVLLVAVSSTSWQDNAAISEPWPAHLICLLRNVAHFLSTWQSAKELVLCGETSR